MGLFDDEIPADSSPIDKTEISTTILYFSTEELIEFRKLAKKTMKIMFPQDFQKKNIADLFLQLLKERNENLSS